MYWHILTCINIYDNTILLIIWVPHEKNTGNNRYTFFFGTLAQSNIQKMCATSLVHPHKMITPRDHPDVGPSPIPGPGRTWIWTRPRFAFLAAPGAKWPSSCRVVVFFRLLDRPMTGCWEICRNVGMFMGYKNRSIGILINDDQFRRFQTKCTKYVIQRCDHFGLPRSSLCFLGGQVQKSPGAVNGLISDDFRGNSEEPLYSHISNYVVLTCRVFTCSMVFSAQFSVTPILVLPQKRREGEAADPQQNYSKLVSKCLWE